MEITKEIIDRLEILQQKYSAIGQDLVAYLDGLIYADSVKYWDYIQVDSLLSLQKPRTDIPDEKIFIIYHQITELYFKMALNEFEQLADKVDLTKDFFIERVTRINRYFDALKNSFDIMSVGMDKEQFLKFRMSLLPASGFQSAQYRFIEIYSTEFKNLVHKDVRDKFTGNESISEMFEHIYWKEGATEVATGVKTLTLVQFEERYKNEFIELGKKCIDRNLWQVYKRLNSDDQNDPIVIQALKENDINVNVEWPLAHYKSAVRYLGKKDAELAATGGTNWHKYLPPRFQKRIFYPEIWSEKEKEEWGKTWVESVLSKM